MDSTVLDPITVPAPWPGYATDRSSTATKTDTPLLDIPQSITVITQELIRDQAMHGMADVVRYIPGIGMAQGEGNRDTPIFRGNASTSDMFIDGMRDDVQYYRDLYNIDRVEAIKGPNAMIFGRGGSGGLLNRVSKIADWADQRSVDLQFGSWNRRRLSADIDQSVNPNAAVRLTAMYEDSESFRDGYEAERYGFNPTLSLRASDATAMTFGYERFHDERVADRGIPSWQGKPVDVDPSTFFGDPSLSPTWATVDAFSAWLDHDFGNDVHLRNSTRFADYDKFYQNVYPGAVSTDGNEVSLAAYNTATQRTNFFNQTDFTFKWQSGAIEHTLLAGAELGRQRTDNFRETGFFGGAGSTVTSITVPISDPRSRGPVEFRQNASDADNHGVAKVAALYVQDQIQLSQHWQAILGVRYDDFKIDFRNNRNGDRFSSSDLLFSPRAGLVYKPLDNLSLYGSYSVAHVPRAGDQLSSLNLSSQALDPEQFTNREIGAKWDPYPGLVLTAAIYRLDRRNIAVANPDYDPVSNPDVAQSLLVDGQRVDGVEIGISGQITDSWRMMGGYAWQDGEITEALSPSIPAGTRIAQLPQHSASLWNRYDFSPMWGAGLGAIYRGEIYASTSNRVSLPGFTRFDAAVYLTLNERVQMQLNVENVFDKAYFASAHNDNNISPGSPRAGYLSINLAF
ncbi:MAG: TonB-dependent siderophore receptor [Dokdonella sp.]